MQLKNDKYFNLDEKKEILIIPIFQTTWAMQLETTSVQLLISQSFFS